MKALNLLLILLLSTVAWGKIWIVDSNPGSTARDFTNLQAAHDGAAPGDTLYLIGSPVNYITSKVTLAKRLIIIGPGYFLNENANTQANVAVAFLNSTTAGCEELEFGAGSEGSVVMGLEIIGRVIINANNILFKRNHIRQEGACNLTMVSVNASNVLVLQNFLDGNLNNAGLPLVGVAESQSGVVIANNYLYHSCAGCGGGVMALFAPVTSSVAVSNNIFFGGITVANGIVENNLFRTGNNMNFTSCLVRNNTANSGIHSLPAGNANENNTGFTFVGAGSTDGQWQLTASSPLKNSGFGGTERGLFGGAEPYVLSGIPPIPTIYSVTAPSVGEKNTGLPVQLKVKSNN